MKKMTIRKNVFRSLFLTALLSAGLCLQTSAAVIYAPGVIPHSQAQGPGIGPGAPAADDSTAPDTSSDISTIIVPVESNAAGATSDSTSGVTENISDPNAAAPEQAAKNTVVPTGEENIVMINGRRIDMTRPIIALTYDDGPQTNAGNRIMDVMAKYGQKCTFFMVGDRVAARASEVQRMAAEGHELANHTMNHVYLTNTNAQGVINQVTACNNVIEQTTGVRPTIMRLPGGCKNATVVANVNMPIILWNVDTIDWKTRNAAKTTSAVLGSAKNGDVILMHELYDATAAATEAIVPALCERGFQMVTVSELAALRGVALNPNQIYYSF